MYDGFWSDKEKAILDQLCNTPPDQIIATASKQPSPKISELAFRFIARNYPKNLNPSERERWEEHLRKALVDGGEKSRISRFTLRFNEVSKRPNLSEQDKYLLTELQLYVESIIPELD
jgi:exodeoxyribonuclease-1